MISPTAAGFTGASVDYKTMAVSANPDSWISTVPPVPDLIRANEDFYHRSKFHLIRCPWPLRRNGIVNRGVKTSHGVEKN